jgi:hypothetical protein
MGRVPEFRLGRRPTPVDTLSPDFGRSADFAVHKLWLDVYTRPATAGRRSGLRHHVDGAGIASAAEPSIGADRAGRIRFRGLGAHGRPVRMRCGAVRSLKDSHSLIDDCVLPGRRRTTELAVTEDHRFLCGRYRKAVLRTALASWALHGAIRGALCDRPSSPVGRSIFPVAAGRPGDPAIRLSRSVIPLLGDRSLY